MTSEQFAEALSRLVAEAEDAGPEPEAIMAELVGMAAPALRALPGQFRAPQVAA